MGRIIRTKHSGAQPQINARWLGTLFRQSELIATKERRDHKEKKGWARNGWIAIFFLSVPERKVQIVRTGTGPVFVFNLKA
jgi:hypothetical protein